MELARDENFTQVANAALQVVRRHTWYLCEETVALCLFSRNCDSFEKQRVAQKLLELDIPEFRLGKPSLPSIIREDTKLNDLVTGKSWFLFSCLGIKASWLAKSPELWGSDPDYCEAETAVLRLRVVNDAAERSIKLLQDYLK